MVVIYKNEWPTIYYSSKQGQDDLPTAMTQAKPSKTANSKIKVPFNRRRKQKNEHSSGQTADLRIAHQSLIIKVINKN